MEPTVRGALRAIIANLVIHSNAAVAVFEEGANADTALLILNQRDDAPKDRENTEFVMVEQACARFDRRRACSAGRGGLRPRKGVSGRAVEAYFACHIRYGADGNVLTFDRALLDRRIERRDVAYRALIKK
jgi:hypothetical protein